MANADTPHGLLPIGNMNGAPYSGATVKCAFVAAQATAAFVGDLVKLSGTASAEGYPSVTQGAASDTAFFGVIESFDLNPDNLTQLHRPTLTLRHCNVVPCTQGQLFKIQCDGAFAITDVGNKADVVVGSGNTTTGLSAMELDSSDIGTGGNLIIHGVYLAPDNAIDTNCEVIVSVSETTFGGDQTAV